MPWDTGHASKRMGLRQFAQRAAGLSQTRVLSAGGGDSQARGPQYVCLPRTAVAQRPKTTHAFLPCLSTQKQPISQGHEHGTLWNFCYETKSQWDSQKSIFSKHFAAFKNSFHSVLSWPNIFLCRKTNKNKTFNLALGKGRLKQTMVTVSQAFHFCSFSLQNNHFYLRNSLYLNINLRLHRVLKDSQGAL